MVVLWVMMMFVHLEDYRRFGKICFFHITAIVVCNGVQNDDMCVFFSGSKPVRHYFVD